MSNLDNLDRRVDKLPAAIEPMPEPKSFKYTFEMHLFSEQEQARLQKFLDLLETKYHFDDKGRSRLDYSQLSDEEFDPLDLWVSLEQALTQEDLATAAKCRRWLAMDLDSLLKAFLTLDLSFLPADFNDPGPKVVEGHCVYHLNRGGYNNIRVNHINRGRIGPSTIEDMRRWIDFAYNSAMMPL